MNGGWKRLVWVAALGIAACSPVLEGVNRGAKETGKTAGQVIRIPSSVGEGAAEGIAGEPASNPYRR
ncbi:MAG: hypothetical protein Kow00128_18110 [Deltaproteobacteria bacterium]